MTVPARGVWASAALLVALAASPTEAQARKNKPTSGEVSSGSAGRSFTLGSDRALPLRLRLGLVGGLAMQKTQASIAGSFDVLPIAERFRLVADVTVGFRPNELTVEPLVGVRVPIGLRSLPKLEPYLAALVGMNVTFMRGGTAVSLPLRIAIGAHYAVSPGISVGGELGTEAGPLIAPFADTYAAMHMGAVVAFAL